jgi:hypothetical protein
MFSGRFDFLLTQGGYGDCRFETIAEFWTMRAGFCICMGRIPARSPRPLYGSPAPVKVVQKMTLALRAGGSVCGSTLTVLGEPKTWLVRILRRDCWPEIFNRSGLRIDIELQRPRAVFEFIARV